MMRLALMAGVTLAVLAPIEAGLAVAGVEARSPSRACSAMPGP